MRADIQEAAARCIGCLRHNSTCHHSAPAKSIVAAEAWSHIQVDLHEPTVPAAGGERYFLVIIDVFSSFTLAIALVEKSATVVAQALWAVFALFGLPAVLQSGNGSEFVNSTLSKLAEVCGFSQALATAYKPSTNGLVERRIRTISLSLLKQIDALNKDWAVLLPGVVHAINARVNQQTGYSPFFLFFNRHPRAFAAFDVDARVFDDADLKAWLTKLDAIATIIIPHFLSTRAQVQARTRKVQNKRNVTSVSIVRLLLINSRQLCRSSRL